MPSMTIDYLLGHLRENTFHHERSASQVFDPRYGHHFPYFNFNTVDAMMRDPRIKYALSLIKGPITTYTRFFNEEEAESPAIHTAIVELNYHFPYAVVCKNKDQEEFIIKQLNRFWEVGIQKAMTAVEWGFSGSQVLYKKNSDGKIVFDNLFPYKAANLQCVTKEHGIIGFIRDNDKTKYIPIGKGFWHLHERETDHYYGNSRLRGAHIPWHETWMMGGARDIRRTWFFKNAYDGGQIYYPEGFYVDGTGNKIQNEELAVRMAEAKRTGSTGVFPSTKGLDGKRAWEFEPAKSNVTPQGMVEYIQILRDEELEGVGIPPEVVQGDGGGMGSATGRMVPLMAFIASLTPLGSDLITDFRQQILDPILLAANGFTDDYEIRRIVPKTIDGMPLPGDDEGPTPVQKKTVKDTGLTT